jgi:carbamoyltransferase
MYILGISAFYHDSAACLLHNGKIIAAAQEERFTRKKHDPSFPLNAIKFCLEHARINIDEVAHIGFYEKPFLKFNRILDVFSRFYPKGWGSFFEAMSLWFTRKLAQPSVIKKHIIEISPSGGNNMLWDGRLIFIEHHLSHASSAFFPSPFSEAAVVSIDGVGEYASTTIAHAKGEHFENPGLHIIEQINYPDSIGLLYSAFTYYLGFKVNSGEYKVMGLAPYGEPKFVDLIEKELISISENGSYQLNMDYFSFAYDKVMITGKFERLFGMPTRRSEGKLESKHFDIAASLQKVTEKAVIKICSHAHEITKSKRLCLAGGVALNCVANGKILENTEFEDIWIQPAAGDAGGALGVAMYIWHQVLSNKKSLTGNFDLMNGSYLGPEFSEDKILKTISEFDLKYDRFNSMAELIEKTVQHLASEKVVGWFQGRMEYGPRALGNRSIIGDPRSSSMQKKMNLKIKFRESFRPFAPSVLREKVHEWFDIKGKKGSLLGAENNGYDSPYMLLVHNVRNDKCIPMSVEQQDLFGIDKLNVVRSEIPSCTHVDYSARIHTVTRESNPLYHELLSKFCQKTDVPILVNTSFNIRGEPIVCTPNDAIRCFLGTDMDILVLGNVVLDKSTVPAERLLDYRSEFELD